MDYRYGLPWNQERGERKRLLAAAVVVVPLFLVFAGYVSWVELPEQDRQEQEALPPQLAKLIVEKKEPPSITRRRKTKIRFLGTCSNEIPIFETLLEIETKMFKKLLS